MRYALSRSRLRALLGNLGAATPQLLAAIALRVKIGQLPVERIRHVTSQMEAEAKSGHVRISRVNVTHKLLRPTEGYQYRVPAWVIAGTPSIRLTFREAVTAVGNLMSTSRDGWVEESELVKHVYPGIVRPAEVRHRLKKVVKAGYLERRQAERHLGAVPVVELTTKGAETLSSPRIFHLDGHTPRLTRAPKQRNVVHHLLLVLAASEILVEQGAKLQQLFADEDLRSEKLKGRQTTAGDASAPLPDGKLLYELPSGEVGSQEIEVLVSKYTTADIRKKYSELAPHGTRFFTISRRLRKRVVGLGLPAPELLR